MAKGAVSAGAVRTFLRIALSHILSIRVQLFLTYLFIMLVSVVITGQFFLYLAGNYVMERNRSLLTSNAEGYSKYISTNLSGEEHLVQLSHDYMWKILGRMNLTLRLANARGELVYDSMIRNLPAGKAADGNVTGALGGKSQFWEESTVTERFLHYSFPVALRDRTIGAADLTISLWDLDNLLAGMRSFFQLIILVSSLLAGALAMVFTRIMLKPLKRIREVAGELSSGNLSSIVDYRALDDPGELGQTINQVAKILRDYIVRLTEDKNKTEVLLASMVDSVVALDRESRITFANNAAVKLFKFEKDMVGESLREQWPQQEVWDLVGECDRENVIADREITRADGAILHVYSVPYGSEELDDRAVMLLIRDITEIRKLELARAQFLNNVSHELKTPLTIIKGFVITLIKSPDIPEDYRRYLEFIDKETDRLTRLVEDLLQVARFRSGKQILKLNFCEPGELLRHTYNQMVTKARENHIYLGLEAPSDLPIILADGDRIKEVLINLVDNAIKYIPSNGRVDIMSQATEEELIIRVSDNGPGIPANELPFLFERFFRGEEKRKRASGTGLGLAIVKEIVDAHGGKIRADSEEGKGTTFTVFLPLRKSKTGKAAAPAEQSEGTADEAKAGA